jgi:hypothetical protein
MLLAHIFDTLKRAGILLMLEILHYNANSCRYGKPNNFFYNSVETAVNCFGDGK